MSRTIPSLSELDLKTVTLPHGDNGFGSLSTGRGNLPLKALDVRSRIGGLVAEVTVSQTFANSLDEPLEATYIFPLPDRASVTAFRMEVGSRIIQGVLKERGEARRDYEKAIEEGRRAAIAEEERPDIFTLRVGNILPGEEATVRLTLVGPLPVADGEATFRFPLVVAPRYIPGIPLPGGSVGDGTALDTDAVPDASRITPPVLLPGYPSPVRLSLSVEVTPAGIPLRDFRSSLHAVVTEEGTGGAIKLRLEPGERIDRDFILRFRIASDAVRTSLSIQPDPDSEKTGTFLLTLLPPAEAPGTRRPRDVVFVLDRSGSMEGWKIVAARRAMARMVDTLDRSDRFSVLAFDDRIETPRGFPEKALIEAADRNRFQAVEFLSRIEARGGTEMAGPLLQAAALLEAEDGGRDRVLVLVTDGQVGNEDQILKELQGKIAKIRVFTLGIDRSVNMGFLNRLSEAGGGIAEFVESEDRLDEVMDRVHRRIGTPILTGLEIEAAGISIEADSIVPERFPDLFPGLPVFISGRWSGASGGTMAVRGSKAGGEAWAESLRPEPAALPALPSIWARGRIRDLEDRYSSGKGNRESLEKLIVETSLRFGVLSRFTAFVAVEETVSNEGGKLRRIIQPVESPQGWDMMDSVVCAPMVSRIRGARCHIAYEPQESQAMGYVGMRSGMGLFGGRSQFSPEACRNIAGEVLDFLSKRGALDPAFLKRLLELLDDLLKALKSWGGEKDLLKSVKGLLKDLKKGPTEELLSRIEKTLKDFIGGPAGGPGPQTPPPDRKGSFWKPSS